MRNWPNDGIALRQIFEKKFFSMDDSWEGYRAYAEQVWNNQHQSSQIYPYGQERAPKHRHRIIDGTEQFSVKSTNDQDFCALTIVNLTAVLVEHTVICVLELDAMAAIYGSFVENGENQVDFLGRGLILEDRFDIMKRESKFVIEFFYVGVQEFVGGIPGRDACQPKLDWQAGLKRLVQALNPAFGLRNTG